MSCCELALLAYDMAGAASCCTSCHEDVGEGYYSNMCFVADPENPADELECCCRVAEAIYEEERWKLK